jgi:hypothetical protein
LFPGHGCLVVPLLIKHSIPVAREIQDTVISKGVQDEPLFLPGKHQRTIAQGAAAVFCPAIAFQVKGGIPL